MAGIRFRIGKRKSRDFGSVLVIIPASPRSEKSKPVFREIPLFGLEKHPGRA
jgi:hypothetical protein